MSLMGALHLGARGVELNRIGLQVTGNNISNAGTEGYVREEVKFAPVLPTKFGGVVIGNGATAQSVLRKVDRFLAERARSLSGEYESLNAASTLIRRAENVFNELGDNDLSTQLANFFSTIHDVLAQPSDPSLRNLIVQQGETAAQAFRDLRAHLDGLREDVNTEVRVTATEINDALDKLRKINAQLVAFESGSNSEANALRTVREQELRQISAKIEIKVYEQADGQLNIYSGNDFLLMGTEINQLGTAKTMDHELLIDTLVFASSQYPVPTVGGRVGGLQQARDGAVSKSIEALDKLARTLLHEFNKLHSSGQGLKAYTSLLSQARVLDPTAALQATAAGLDFPPTNGGFEMRLYNASTGSAVTQVIHVDLDGIGADDSLNGVAAKINAAFGATVATVTGGGQLQLTAPAGSQFSFANDTSGFLAGMGINTFFAGANAKTIAVNPDLLADASYFAAAQNYLAGDVANARALAQFRDQTFTSLQAMSFKEYFTGMVQDLGSMSETAAVQANSAYTSKSALEAENLAITGVSLDEEAIKLMQYQRGFQASARYISTVNQLLEVVINLGQ